MNFDIHIKILRVDYKELSNDRLGESARARQRVQFADALCVFHNPERRVSEVCQLQVQIR